MSFAEICVNSPAGRSQLFTYSIPPGLAVTPGCAVWAPFGSRTLQGIVVNVSNATEVEMVRPLSALVEREPLITIPQISLAKWISEYYLASLFSALSLFLPPGFERRAVARISLSERAAFLDVSSLEEESRAVLSVIKEKGSLTPGEMGKALGKKTAEAALDCLMRNGFIERRYDVAPLRVKPKMEKWIRIKSEIRISKHETSNNDQNPNDQNKNKEPTNTRRAPRQAALLEYLRKQPDAVPLAQLTAAGFKSPVVRALVESGAITQEERRVTRKPSDTWGVQPSFACSPTPAQARAIADINACLDAGQHEVFLLHGVTGAGKTEVYLQALAYAVSRGKQGIVLVPEIALTPQTVERFAARFSGKVAVYHSGLSLGEQYDTWHDIKKGLYDIVVGARSALFTPLARTGIIVIDEEHEWTYKQGDQSPRYHTRAAALRMAEENHIPLVMGSATPDVESYHMAEGGGWKLLELPERLTPRPGTPLPPVEVVDLKEELRAGNCGIFSRRLLEGIQHALAQEEQVILFFNRRGSSSAVECRNCGYVAKCPSCSVSLSHHGAEASLVCHQCGLRRKVPEKCPSCGSKRIRFLGLGTQKVMDEAAVLFPGARLLRWDSDSARGKGAHREIFAKLRRREADILIGTQLVAKGLDLPQVTLVGVVSADTALGLPDFRSGERTFQLLSQVAGRAGRGEQPGRVVIQTYNPEHYAVRAAGEHNYAAFYQREIEYRRTLGNPPYCSLVRLTYIHVNEAACQREAARVKKKLEEEIAAQGVPDVSVLGPAPAFITRLRGRYRWQLLVKGRRPAELTKGVDLPGGWMVDVDPVGL